MATYQKEKTGWKKNPIVLAVVVAVVLLLLWGLLFQSDGKILLAKQDAVCSVESCSHASRYPFSKTDIPPIACPECGQKTFYPARKCNACKKTTPLLPPMMDYSCTACEHHAEASLNPKLAPHPCPSCKKKTFLPSYKCQQCEHIFGHLENVYSECPKCKHTISTPITEHLVESCYFCNSTDLSPITPHVVHQLEMGLKLRPEEQQIYDKWKAAGGK